MRKTLLVLCFSAGILVSCNGDMVDLAIDNPTADPIIVSIDSLTVEVPSKEVVWVEMGKGYHSITLANDSIVNFNFTQNMYMLNAALIPYLKFEQIYGNEASASALSSTIPSDTVYYLGMELVGHYAIVDELVNPITWDYGPREALPESVEIDGYEGASKLVKLMDPWELSEQIGSAGNESGS